MSTRHDPAEVLLHLARTLNVEKTQAAFPGMTKDELADILSLSARSVPTVHETAVLYVDGAARGNPGPAGAGVVLEGANGPFFRLGQYLGEATNNVAEYKALNLGMESAAQQGIKELQVRSDSELVVKQLNGQYRVKNPNLQDLYFIAIKAISSFDKISFKHIPREENKEADRMANLAIDAKGRVEL